MLRAKNLDKPKLKVTTIQMPEELGDAVDAKLAKENKGERRSKGLGKLTLAALVRKLLEGWLIDKRG